MKAPFFRFAFFVAGMAFLAGCQKDVSELASPNSPDSKSAVSKQKSQEHMLKGQYDAYWDTTMGAQGNWAYGSGEGHLNILGKSRIYYNTISPYTALNLFYNAPVTQFFATELWRYGFTGLGTNVSSIMLDQQGNSIQLEIKQGTVGEYTFHEMPPNLVTPVDLKAEYKIVGGTGKFEEATGDILLTGYWDPKWPHETLLVINGEIVF